MLRILHYTSFISIFIDIKILNDENVEKTIGTFDSQWFFYLKAN